MLMHDAWELRGFGQVIGAVVSMAAITMQPQSGDPMAQGSGRVDREVAIELEAEVQSLCGATNELGSEVQVIRIDFGSLSNTPAGVEVDGIDPLSFRYVCNDPDGFTRVLTSQNNGFLVRTGTSGGANNSIPYFVEADGVAGLQLARTQLLSPRANSVAGSSALLEGVTGRLILRVEGVRQGTNLSTVFAGEYSDTLTLSVTAN
jgi:hypothetical protein